MYRAPSIGGLKQSRTRVKVESIRIRVHLVFVLLSFSYHLSAQTGPGGVGTSDGTSDLSAWYRVDNGLLMTGSLIDSWLNSAGYSALDLTEAGTNRPTLVTNALNGFNEVSFNGANKLTTAVGAMTTSNFITNQASTFIVNRADNTTQQSAVYTTDPLNVDRFSNHIPWAGDVYFDMGTCCADRIVVPTVTNLTNYSLWSYDAVSSIFGKQLYRNGLLQLNVPFATTSYAGHTTDRFNLGGFTSGVGGYAGDMTEVIIYRQKVNSAQRNIIENYLSAKYGIPLVANDLYTQDNSGYDYEVAGIGRALDLSTQSDSRGPGIVRISNPNAMGLSSFFFWGHDNGALVPQASDLPPGIAARLSRVWAGQEVGGMDRFDIDFDLTGMGPVTPSDLRLLVDTDNSFATGATIISGATSLGSNNYRFSSSNSLTNSINTVTRFTLGTINTATTPLPITLSSFTAVVDGNKQVKASWTTTREINNDFFTVERSADGRTWSEVTILSGSGNTNTTRSYESYDERPLWGRSYYRLKQTDFDQKFSYSHVASVELVRTFDDIEVFPVPARGQLFVKYPPSENIFVRITDQLGREYIIQPVSGGSEISLNVSALSPGIYVVHLINGKQRGYRKIVIE